MIQFNLLPDVKLEYVKAQRTKRFLTLVSFVVSVVAIAVLLVSMVTVDVVQKKSLHDLNSDITRYSTQIKGIPNLDKVLTVQNQLNTLSSLHDQKPVVTRLFTDIAKVTPAQAGLDQLSIDFTANSMTVGGKAPSLDTVSAYTDTLKATMYSISGSNSGQTHAFSNVVLSSFGRDQTGATFTITCNFDPVIFNTKYNVMLTVPKTANASQSSVFQGGS